MSHSPAVCSLAQSLFIISRRLYRAPDIFVCHNFHVNVQLSHGTPITIGTVKKCCVVVVVNADTDKRRNFSIETKELKSTHTQCKWTSENWREKKTIIKWKHWLLKERMRKWMTKRRDEFRKVQLSLKLFRRCPLKRQTNEFALNRFAAYVFPFVISRKIRQRVCYRFCFCATRQINLFRLTEFHRKFQLFDCRLDKIAFMWLAMRPKMNPSNQCRRGDTHWLAFFLPVRNQLVPNCKIVCRKLNFGARALIHRNCTLGIRSSMI